MNSKTISKELKSLIKEKQSHCTTEAQKNHAVNQARAEINSKYGHGWRDTYDDSKGGSSWYSKNKSGQSYDFNKPFDAQNLGDEWDDYAWSADDF